MPSLPQQVQIEVVSVASKEDITDPHAVILVSHGQRSFLLDRCGGQSRMTDLSGEAWPAQLDSAKAEAIKAKLSKVYLVKHR